MKTSFFSHPGLLLYMAAAILLLLSSCDKRIRKNGSGAVITNTRAVSGFSQLDVDGSYELYVHVDESPRVEITTDDNLMNEVHTFVQGDKLFIEMSDDYYNYRYTRMEVHVYGNTYNLIDVNGSVNTHVQDTIFNPSLTFHHNGTGHNSLKFSGNHVEMKVDGSANVQASGIANNATYTINGSGKMDGLDLQLVDGFANINGSGDIYLNCSNHLDASIEGSGRIRYIGGASVTSHINGSGSISPY